MAELEGSGEWVVRFSSKAIRETVHLKGRSSARDLNNRVFRTPGWHQYQNAQREVGWRGTRGEWKKNLRGEREK